jgi:hypothetical protein
VAVASDASPHCVVTSCAEPIYAEVHDGNYAKALAMFRGVHRIPRTRRVGDERLYCCRFHLENDPRMRGLQWQVCLPF